MEERKKGGPVDGEAAVTDRATVNMLSVSQLLNWCERSKELKTTELKRFNQTR